jgi:hypothetical protein
MPFAILFIIIELAFDWMLLIPIYGSLFLAIILESIEIHQHLVLAFGTIMGAAATHEDAPDRSSTNQAWLPGTEIYPMFELEEAFYAGRVHIIRNGRAAEGDCLLQYTLQAGVEAIKFCPLQVASHPTRPDSCPEKALVGINIPHAMQELLIEQGCLDGGAAGPEERRELVPRNIKRLLAGPGEACLLAGDAVKRQTPEAPRVDKAQLSPRGEMQDAMRVRGNRGRRIGDQQPPGHAQMHDPLQMLRPGGRRPVCQIKDDVFAYPVDTVNAPPGQFLCH